ncbi:MAG TPA: murein biosynthesis integral membrane protein MurJ [Rugosimonospora sp.]|nr:murein biosynthesis integral membrane protein MurJ [Rugosimonospora sp.]
MTWEAAGDPATEPERRRKPQWYEQDATMVLPIVAPEATMVLPSQAPTQPMQVPPRHAAPDHGQSYGTTYRSTYAGQIYSGRHAEADQTQRLPRQPAAPREDEMQSLAHNSAVMAAGSIVSRITGFLRTAVLAAALGSNVVADDYNLANNLPNQVYELLMGGVLTSVIVPLLMRARKNDPDRGESYAQRLLTLATVFLGVTTIISVLAAPLITAPYRAGGDQASGNLLTVFSYLLLPEIFFYGVAALVGAILNTRGHFAAPMWTPILNNIVVIITGGLFMLLPSHGLTPGTVTGAQVLVLGIGTTLGIVVQAAGMLPALRRVRFRWKWRWDWRELHLRELLRISGWMLMYVVVSQVALVIVLKIAYLALLHHGGGGVTIFNTAYVIFVMAYGIVAVSISTALMPRMSAAAAEGRNRDLADLLSLGARLTAVVLIVVTAGYLVLGRDLAITLFNFGQYGHDAAVATGWTVAMAGLGLVPFTISQMQLFTFYAMPDTKTPALLNVPIAFARVVLDLLLYLILPATWVVPALMFGNAASYVLAAAIGNRLLRKRIGYLGFSKVLQTLTRLSVAAVVAALPTILITVIIRHVLGDGKLGSAFSLLIGGAVLAVVYLAVAVGLRVSEINQVWGMVRGRVRR